MNKNVLLLILDGWGMGENNEHNAIELAKPKYWQKLWQEYPHSILQAKEEAVGLPIGCMSGSEVGHLTLGAGRVVWQGAARIEKSIDDGSFFENNILKGANSHLKEENGKLHLVGLLSDGGIHSHINHLEALIKWTKDNKIKNVCLHLFLDGRDMAQKSALDIFVKRVLPLLNDDIKITTICGRAVAMDRSENWERTNMIYDLLTSNKNFYTGEGVSKEIEKNYEEGITDEFIQPTRFSKKVIEKNDAVIFFNFRADRMRQLVRLFTGRGPHIEQEKIEVSENLYLASMTEYDPEYREVWTMFPPEYPKNTLGEWLSVQGVKQFRIAETEKYAHITYFFNGGQEREFVGEERLVIPSLGLINYASNPEMSLPEVVNMLSKVLKKQEHGLVVSNFANGDMVGHSGNLEAGIQAVKEVDKALSQIVPVALENNFTVIITADHGNIEKMKENDEPHTAHTFNDVPLLVIDKEITLPESGSLPEVAPLILKIMGLPIPEEMKN